VVIRGVGTLDDGTLEARNARGRLAPSRFLQFPTRKRVRFLLLEER
jgi:hypothetical protein